MEDNKYLKSHEVKAKIQEERRKQWFNDKKADWDLLRIHQESLLCKLHVLQERTRDLFINSNILPEADVPLFVDEEYYAPNTQVNKVLQQNLYWIDPNMLTSSKIFYTNEEVLAIVRNHLEKKFPSGDLLFLIFWGSRASGNSDILSDWDIVAIMKNIDPPDLEVNTIEIGRYIDVSVHEFNSFQKLIDSHCIWAIYLTYFPKSTYLYNKDSLCMKDVFQVEFQFPKLKHEMFTYCVTLLNQGFSYYRALAIRRAKKRLVYVLRHIDYICQILEYGDLQDVGKLNQLAKEIMLMNFECGAEFEQFANRECESRLQYFKTLVNAYKVTESEVIDLYNLREIKQNSFPIFVIYYIQKKGIQSLYKELGIKTTFHSKYSNLVHLITCKDAKYFSSHVMMASNGLVVGLDSMKLVSYPYNHFPEHDNRYLFGNKSSEASFVRLDFNIDWNSAVVYEKLDGYLVTLYYYKNEWHTSSILTPDASEIVLESLSLSKLFWQVFHSLKYQTPDPSLNRCYMFELCTNKVRKIVFHETDRIVLHGCRDLTTMTEIDPHIVAKENSWEAVPIIKPPQSGNKKNMLQSWNVFVNRLSPFVTEGYIVRDAQWNRIAITSTIFRKYKEYKEITEEIKKKAALMHLLLSSWEDFEETVKKFPYPSDLPLLLQVLSKFEESCKELDVWYSSIKDSLQLTNNTKVPYGPYFFKAEIFHSFRAGKCKSFKEAFISFYPKSDFLQLNIEQWVLQNL